MLFKRKKNIVKTNDVHDKIANRIVSTWIRMQERWAAFMQRMFEKVSLAGKKFLLVCMCVLFGGYSLYIIAESFGRRNKTFSVVTPIKTPRHSLKTGDPERDFDPESEYKKIEQLKHYRDSIYKNAKKNK